MSEMVSTTRWLDRNSPAPDLEEEEIKVRIKPLEETISRFTSKLC